MKIRFSDAFLASHRRQRMQNYTYCCSWHVWLVWRSISQLCVSCRCRFWLSGHLFSAMQFISEFMNVRWNGPTWQAKTIISYMVRHKYPTEKRLRKSKSTWSEYSAREPISVSRLPTCDQSATQECRFATPKNKTNKQLKTNRAAFGLGRVIMLMLQSYFLATTTRTVVWTDETEWYSTFELNGRTSVEFKFVYAPWKFVYVILICGNFWRLWMIELTVCRSRYFLFFF